jgi:hypothetical protein
MALKVQRNSLWTHNTNNIGHLGLHSETRNLTIAKNTCVEKHFGVLITALKSSEKQNIRIMSGNRRDLEQSLLALSQRMREINQSRLSLPASRNTSFSPRDSRSISDGSTFSFSSSRTSVSSFNSFSKYIGRRLSPVKGKRKSRKSIEIDQHEEEGKKRERKIATVSPPDIEKLREMSDKPSEFAEKSKFSLQELQERIAARKSYVCITPFPDLPADTDTANKEDSSSVSTDDSVSSSKSSLRVRKKSKPRKKSSRESVEDVPVHEPESPRNNPHARMIALQKLQMETQRKAALIEKQRLELIKKNRKEVTESFRYSHAIEQFLKSKRQNSKISMSDVPDEIEYDAEGREIHRLGPSVLTVINVDDMDHVTSVTVRRRRHTTSSLGEKRPSFYRTKSRKSIASIYHPLPEIKKESHLNPMESSVSTKKLFPNERLPTVAEDQLVVVA